MIWTAVWSLVTAWAYVDHFVLIPGNCEEQACIRVEEFVVLPLLVVGPILVLVGIVALRASLRSGE